jgi:hypothetical protein
VKAISDPKKIGSISDRLKKLVDAEFPRVMIKHAISDLQLNDIATTIRAFIAEANPSDVDIPSKEALSTELPTNKASSKEAPSKKARVKKQLPKQLGPKNTVSKKTRSKKKANVSVRRKAKTTP